MNNDNNHNDDNDINNDNNNELILRLNEINMRQK